MILLTRGLQEQITAAIRAGAFPEVAAGAFGVPRRLFDEWRKRGRGDAEEPFHSFAQAVDVAIAQARLRAEMSVFNEQPRIWLQHGPGRESLRQRGWTTAVKPRVAERTSINPLMTPEIQEMLREFFAALTDEPRAREKASIVLEKLHFPAA
jgi:hypothetical protein